MAAPKDTATIPDATVIKSPEPTHKTFFGAAWNHISQWTEGYLHLPLALIVIILLAKFAGFLTGRKPLDQQWDFVGLGYNAFICIILITLLSIRRQALGVWLTRDQRLAHPYLSMAQSASSLGFAIIFTWILLH